MLTLTAQWLLPILRKLRHWWPTALIALTGAVIGQTAIIVAGPSMEPGLSSGDLVLVSPWGSPNEGDVIAFRVPSGHQGAGTPIIHRVLNQEPTGLTTVGDNNSRPDPWLIQDRDIIGRRLLMIPGLGNAFVIIKQPWVLAAAAGGFATYLFASAGPKGNIEQPTRRPRRQRAPQARPNRYRAG